MPAKSWNFCIYRGRREGTVDVLEPKNVIAFNKGNYIEYITCGLLKCFSGTEIKLYTCCPEILPFHMVVSQQMLFRYTKARHCSTASR